MMGSDAKQRYAQLRDAALTEVIRTGREDAMLALCRQFGVEYPQSRRARYAGYYKMAQYCTNLPDEIREKALIQCIRMGFQPWIDDYGVPEMMPGGK